MPLFNTNQPTLQSTPEQQSLTPEPTWVEQSNKGKVTINSLLSGVQTSSSSRTTLPTSGNLSEVQEKRFVTVKYKLYTLAIVCALILFYWPVSDALSVSWSKRQDGNKIDDTITTRIDSQEEYKSKIDLLKQIDQQKDIIITCVNENDKCDQLPDSIKSQLDNIKTYLQIGSLKKEKMDINESKILKNINEFMLQTDPLATQRRYNGTVTNIVIGKTAALENHIVQVPITLTVTFNTKENLINFLGNIENKIFYNQTDGLNDSILYRIDQIKYDIVNYKESQDVEVNISAYAYDE